MKLSTLAALMALYSVSAKAGWWDGLSGGKPTSNGSASAAPKEQVPKLENAEFSKAMALYEKGEFDSAFPIFLKEAGAGNAAAQNKLVHLYAHGLGTKKDPKEAFRWSKASANQGDPRGEYNLGFCYVYGIGVQKSVKPAAQWLRKSADQGNEDGQFLLGAIYIDGTGVPKDFAEGTNWLRKAAAQGNKTAQEVLGNFSHEGKIDKSDAQAATWYQESLERQKIAKAEKNAKRMDALTCKCQATLDFVQAQIDRENEIGKVSGVVDKVKLHQLGQTLVSIREYLGSASSGRTPASSCSAKPTVSTYQSCMETVGEHLVGQLRE